MTRPPWVIAHRACPLDAAENSLEGIAVAHAARADVVELDVRRTRDGVPVLFHDRLPWRTARWPVPTVLTGFARLSRAVGKAHPGGLVTLAQALEACPPGLRAALDVKGASALTATLRVVEHSGRRDTLVWCRTGRQVARVRSTLPWVQTALLRNTWTERGTRAYVDDAAAAGAHAVSLHQRAATATAIAYAQERGLLAYVWVVDEHAHELVLARGVDGVVTDWPRVARAAIDR